MTIFSQKVFVQRNQKILTYLRKLMTRYEYNTSQVYKGDLLHSKIVCNN